MDGNCYDYGFRIYNPALGRFLSVDPLSIKYPWYTPYQFAGNKPIIAVDLDGLEEFIKTNWYDANGKVTKTVISINENGPKTNGVYIRTINNYLNSDGKLEFVRTSLDYLSALDFSNAKIGHPNKRGKLDFDPEKHDNPVYGNNFDTRNSLFFEFSNGVGSENTLIFGGQMLKDVRELPTVKTAIRFAAITLNADGKITPGEMVKEKYTMSKSDGFFEVILPGILRGGGKDWTGQPETNPIVSAKHFLGSYTITGTVLDDGHTMMWVIADSKTIESATDHQKKGNSVDRKDGEIIKNGSTYQRYVWFEELYNPVRPAPIKITTVDNTQNVIKLIKPL